MTVLSDKGGVGKTQISMGLAQLLSNRGQSVCVVDFDSGGTASSWAYTAQEAGKPLPFEVVPYDQLERLQGGAYDFRIFDTPANRPDVSQEMVRHSDVIFIPVLPGGAELDRLHHTLEGLGESSEIQEHTRVGIILNRAKPRTLLTQATQLHLRDNRMEAVLQIPDHTRYATLFGRPLPFNFTHLLEELAVRYGLLDARSNNGK